MYDEVNNMTIKDDLKYGLPMFPDRTYRLQAHNLKMFLGLGSKLPDNKERLNFRLKNIALTLFTKREAHGFMPKSKRPHRLYARCPECMCWLPAGRLQQHTGTGECARLAADNQNLGR